MKTIRSLQTLLLVFLGMLPFNRMIEARLLLCPGEFGFEAEWIFFRASTDDTYVALEGSIVTSGDNVFSQVTLENNDFNYQSGYRVGAAYNFSCLDLTARLRWMQHWSSASRGLSEPAIVISTLSPTNIISSDTGLKSSLDFYNLDATFESLIFCDPCCFDLLLFVGLQYSSAEKKQEIKYQNARIENPEAQILRLDFSTCFYGVGPEVGLDFSYPLGCGFGFTGSGRCGVLVSNMDARRKTSNRLVPGAGTTLLSDDSIEKNWRLVPAYDVRFGAHYGYNFKCASLEMEMGYEALSLFRALPIVTQQQAYWNVMGYSNVDFHGPYLNLAVMF